MPFLVQQRRCYIISIWNASPRRVLFGMEWNEFAFNPRAHFHCNLHKNRRIRRQQTREREREKHNRHELTMVKNKWKKKQNIIRTMHDAQCTIHTETTIHVNAFPLAFSFERLKCSFVLCIEVHIFAFSFIVWWFCYFYVLCSVAWRGAWCLCIFQCHFNAAPCAVIATACRAAADTELQKGWLAGVFRMCKELKHQLKCQGKTAKTKI